MRVVGRIMLLIVAFGLVGYVIVSAVDEPRSPWECPAGILALLCLIAFYFSFRPPPGKGS